MNKAFLVQVIAVKGCEVTAGSDEVVDDVLGKRKLPRSESFVGRVGGV